LYFVDHRKNLINWEGSLSYKLQKRKKKNWINDESDERRYDTYKEDKKKTQKRIKSRKLNLNDEKN
jgi:hypothetical protein